jgi:hypothetical protein
MLLWVIVVVVEVEAKTNYLLVAEDFLTMSLSEIWATHLPMW